MPNGVLSALSLSRKAGMLVTGFDAVKDSVNNGKAYAVFFANDISDGTKKRLLNFCEDFIDAYQLPLTQFELISICKKPTGVFAVIDENLCTLCIKKLDAQPYNHKEEQNEFTNDKI